MRRGGLLFKRSSLGSYKLLEKGRSASLLKKWKNKKNLEVLDFSDQLAMPGFYDMHFHWVQDDVRLMPKKSLLEWLSRYTWPYESKFKSKNYSEKKAKKFAHELLSVGTLGGAVYSSLHGHTVDHAFKYFVGDFIVGNVLMTMNSPEYLCQTEAQALDLVKKKSQKFGPRYALTPRFALTTSPAVMAQGVRLARSHKSFIQTHLSETPEEIASVLSLYRKIQGFENVESYTDIYRKCGILGSRTIMGHGIHLKPKELRMLSESRTAVAHCPTSNAPVKERGLGSGLFDFKKIEKHKIRWALATDIGGGPFLSMFDVMRSFVHQNRRAKVSGATYVKALYRSTLSGAEILGREKVCGSFEKGKLGNFFMVTSPRVRDGENAEDVLRKTIEKRSLKREAYSDFVREVFYLGNSIYRR